ncbi:MAG: HipA domain-containing protein, partial [Candidatus Muiribacteriota bacterium]
MSNFLKVFLFNNFIGVLKETKSGALSFKYNQNVDYNLRLSMRIPVSSEIYSDKYARPFFENVLPEGDIRLKISNLKKISPNNIYKLIEAVGSECAGAVSLFPEDYEFDSFKSNSLIKLSENDLLNLIKNQNIAPLLMNNNNRLSLAGAQKKFALVKKDENYFFPDFENPSTTIIKVDNLNFPGIIENEFFCMKLAALSNIPVCDVDLKTIQDYKFLEVNRYDRFFESNKISRIHQEDFCQALGFISNRKYQSEGGPSIK